ncbi:MAG: hypothetical protein KJ583_07645 [Nanoarchaeota archaeon]|nr:hypothetical protein [Nanoarchaeota archaeon]MBU1269852.1 hypothetical protein [Nanoarchaeota archaeon]MBU1605161.1 hypothetical protein [Nanoarchaeota archaeon]MBU2443661.1 hypothetical protein [Nanoarchaeota archaeon]
MNKIKIIKPTLKDLEAVVNVEKAAWPDIGDGMVAEHSKFKTRIELGLMHLLYFNGKPAGIISYQYPSFTNSEILNSIYDEHTQKKDFLSWDYLVHNFKLPKNWYEATNNGFVINDGISTNNYNSDCVFLIGVGVDTKLKGNGLVNYLISHTIKEAKQEGKKFVLGYGRLPQLSEQYENPTIIDAQNHLLKLKPNTDLPDDYGARFHVFNGARAVSVIPNAMDDPESKNYGFLALYNLK